MPDHSTRERTSRPPPPHPDDGVAGAGLALNTAALERPEVLTALADEFGGQCVVLSIDTRRRDDRWVVTTHSATRGLDRECIAWAEEGVRGVGEILLNVIDADGGRNGFAVDITRAVADVVSVPVIASGQRAESV